MAEWRPPLMQRGSGLRPLLILTIKDKTARTDNEPSWFSM